MEAEVVVFIHFIAPPHGLFFLVQLICVFKVAKKRAIFLLFERVVTHSVRIDAILVALRRGGVQRGVGTSRKGL